jgi:hypothetical protein
MGFEDFIIQFSYDLFQFFQFSELLFLFLLPLALFNYELVMDEKAVEPFLQFMVEQFLVLIDESREMVKFS